MPTRNVVLTEHQERLIGDLVAKGRYQNASEVLRAGLRLLQREEDRHAAELAALRAAADAGIAAIERGDFRSFHDPQSLERHLYALTDPIVAKEDAG